MKRAVPYLFLAPALLVFLLFSGYPAIGVVIGSFQRHSFLGESTWNGFANYALLLEDEMFLRAMINSLAYLLVTPILVALSLGVAFIMDSGIRGVTFFRAAYFFPAITPMIVVGIAWRWMLNEDFGLLIAALQSLGLVTDTIPWLSEYPLNLIATMSVTIWKGVGYYGLIFLGSLLAIPKELEESAVVDGASGFQIMTKLKLPLLRPAIVTVVILSSISALKVFDELYVMMPGAPMEQQTLVPLIYQTAFLDFRLGLASAMSIVLFALTIGLTYVNARMIRHTT